MTASAARLHAVRRWWRETHPPPPLARRLELVYTGLIVVAIFGVEFVINLGGPELHGWNSWLAQNGSRSPLLDAPTRGVEDLLR